jgi:subtilase family serine protease
LTVPAAAGAGSTITISDTTKNQGAGSVGASTTRFYLSANASLDVSDTLLSGSRAVPSLGPGVSSAGSTNVTIPANVPSGSYYVIAKADADNVVAEVEEGNNTAVRAIRFGGDLVVSALTVPSRGSAGASIVVSDTTANQGAGGVGASTTRFYFSKDAIIDATDTLLAGGRSVPDLAIGATSIGSTTITLPSPLVAGAYYVIAKADADNVVDESQETNNATARAITVGADLTVGNPSVTFTIVAGSTVSVTDVVQNVGGDPAGASTTRFYLSANVLFDAGDTLLSGSRAVPALAAGASSTGTSMVTIPAGTPPGYYYLFALADADGMVTEAVETNNAAARGIQVTP